MSVLRATKDLDDPVGLIGRIQLSREQVVDQAVIRLTESRERYVEALLAVARARTRTQFIPATLFLRRTLLKKRVAEILKETTMTSLVWVCRRSRLPVTLSITS